MKTSSARGARYCMYEVAIGAPSRPAASLLSAATCTTTPRDPLFLERDVPRFSNWRPPRPTATQRRPELINYPREAARQAIRVSQLIAISAPLFADREPPIRAAALCDRGRAWRHDRLGGALLVTSRARSTSGGRDSPVSSTPHPPRALVLRDYFPAARSCDLTRGVMAARRFLPIRAPDILDASPRAVGRCLRHGDRRDIAIVVSFNRSPSGWRRCCSTI